MPTCPISRACRWATALSGRWILGVAMADLAPRCSDAPACLPSACQLAIVEPDDVYRHQAVERLQPFTTQPVGAWAGIARAPACLL